MSLQGPSSSDSQSRDLIPKALGPGLRSGQGGPALAKELSNQATSLSNAMLLKLRPKKIKYQNFEGSVSMQMFSFGLRAQIAEMRALHLVEMGSLYTGVIHWCSVRENHHRIPEREQSFL